MRKGRGGRKKKIVRGKYGWRKKRMRQRNVGVGEKKRERKKIYIYR